MNFPTIEFKIELLKRNISQKQIANHFGVDRSLVSQVVNNFCDSPIRDRLMCMLQDMRADKLTRLEDY